MVKVTKVDETWYRLRFSKNKSDSKQLRSRHKMLEAKKKSVDKHAVFDRFLLKSYENQRQSHAGTP